MKNHILKQVLISKRGKTENLFFPFVVMCVEWEGYVNIIALGFA